MNGAVVHADVYIFAIHKWLSLLSAGTKFRGVISHWWFSAGGQRRVCDVSRTNTHTLLSRAEIKVEESAAAVSLYAHASRIVSFKMFVRTMWNSHFTHDSVTLNHYSHCKSSHFALARRMRECASLLDWNASSDNILSQLHWQEFLAARIRTRGEKSPEAFAFPRQTRL